MAAKCGVKSAAAGAFFAILMAVAMAIGSADATSSLTSWAGPGCSGQTATAGSCGCSDLQFYGGQEFSYQGQMATLYTETGCAGTPYLVFEDTEACGDFGWRSINIDC
ncbi:hypothetical protein PAHAL_7G265500 [Panicum hallii]|jgi:hypothetical protein|uniref:Antimicrobial peptide 1 n=1 Tax=Panicum hallii TaxID=206008 RepID=A0A2S3I9M3_9POAL|nr:antimicrobial peptide 1-like [Panicum hallii]PAN39742.1 hypothetical protein PAHAL_7G265500 [Panicum hallii]